MRVSSRRMGLGEYSGRCVRRLRAHGLLFTENRFPPGRSIERHSHLYPHLTLLLKGGFIERYDERVLQVPAGSVLIVPSDQFHSDEICSEGAHSLSIEISTRLTHRISRESSVLGEPAVIQIPALFSLGKRIYEEFAKCDNASPLTLEVLSLQLVLGVVKATKVAPSASGPAWLADVVEYLDSRYLEKCQVSDIAAVAGVHEAHLMRVFSANIGCTIGEYVRNLRLQFAAERLHASRDSIAEIASDAGFCDQAHLCRSFKSLYGVTPTKFRLDAKAGGLEY